MGASSVRGSADTRFVAVASRDTAKARGFAAEFGLPLSFGSYQDLLACPEVDAVYVPLPISMHTEWTVRAHNAGKHVLCEKPFAMTAADAGRCFDAAKAANRLVIEGLMWREHPQTAVAMQLVADGAIGRLALVRAALSVSAPPGDVLGGGAVLDLGMRYDNSRELHRAREKIAGQQVTAVSEWRSASLDGSLLTRENSKVVPSDAGSARQKGKRPEVLLKPIEEGKGLAEAGLRSQAGTQTVPITHSAITGPGLPGPARHLRGRRLRRRRSTLRVPAGRTLAWQASACRAGLPG
jgi:hypothetical protein